MRRPTYLLVLGALVLTSVVWAVDLEVPEGDPLATLLHLFMNIKAMAPLSIAMGLIVGVVQSLKKFLPSSAAKKGAVVFLGVVHAVLQAIFGGLSVADAVVLVLLTSGGAVAIYEWVVKPLLKKEEKDVIQPLPGPQ